MTSRVVPSEAPPDGGQLVTEEASDGPTAGTTYHELGGDYYDRRHRQRLTRRAIQLLPRQGYRVTLGSAA